MKQEKVVEKVLQELIGFNLCREEDEEEVYAYLMQVYAAGYDRGWVVYTHRGEMQQVKPIIQMKEDGHFIKIWESGAEAARELDMKRPGISKCCKGHVKTYRGFKWKYAPTTSFSEPTVGSVQSELNQPEPETRASKIASGRSPRVFP